MTFVLDKGECLDYSETRSKIHSANYRESLMTCVCQGIILGLIAWLNGASLILTANSGRRFGYTPDL